MAMVPVQIVVSLTPVLAFLVSLLFLDSYKLVKLRSILVCLGAGVTAALVCLLVNRFLMDGLSLAPTPYRRYLAPVIEELLKALYLVVLLKRKRIGFMVDAAIFGFSLGAGFAVVENIQYLLALEQSNPLLWLIRGFGTAIMHGGTTALAGIMTKTLMDRHSSDRIRLALPGLATAVVIHSFFNHFFFHPLLSTVLILLVLPPVFLLVFERSEKYLRDWLDLGFGSDMELLAMIRSGRILKSKMGRYLVSLKENIPGEVLADMLCYLQISVELALKAKGTLLMHEAGFRPPPEQDVRDKLKELKQLEINIGKTGKRILAPFIHLSSQDLWQIHMLQNHTPVGPGRGMLRKKTKKPPVDNTGTGCYKKRRRNQGER